MTSKRKSRGRIIWFVLGGVVLIFVLLAVLKQQGVIGKSKGDSVEYVFPERRDIVETITANGRIRPQVEIKISPEVSGEITELNVIEGQAVKKGELLCRIKPDIYQSMLDQAEAALKASRTRLEQAKERLAQQKRSLDRTQRLFDEKAVSEQMMEQAQTEYELASSEVEAARHQLESTQESRKQAVENLQKTTIYAPGNYHVSTLAVERGERVVGTAQMAGTEVMRLADLSKMEARVQVAEADVIHVSVGDTAIVHVDAYPDTTFRGIVTLIANSAQTVASVDQVINYEVRILMLHESFKYLLKGGIPSPFKPGMSVTVDIMTERVSNALALPVEAVTLRNDTVKRPDGQQSQRKRKECLFIADGDTARMQFVNTGIRDMQYVEILSPLDDSARVIAGPYTVVSRTLKDKSPIQPTERKKKN